MASSIANAMQADLQKGTFFSVAVPGPGMAMQQGVFVGLPPTQMQIDRAPTLAEQMKELANLRDQGVMDDAEFKQAKQKLLADSNPQPTL